MKIKYLQLKNYANIFTAFKSKEISIDFSKSKNKIILFTGPNGSGKTSILSCLHPFATNGNLDVRNDNPLVRVGKDGYKEIHIEDDGNEYIIKHFYTPSKESHSVKSYIIKNGLELNPNGNVTSFKDVVKDELDIEMDYLKLARLGSNVTNFIDLKTTDRKAFMGKILDEVEIYLKYFKKVSNDMREIKSIISHTIDKISKLNITDEEELKNIQRHLKKVLDNYNSQIEVIKNRKSINEYEISKYDTPLVVKENLDIKKKEVSKVFKLLEKKDENDTSIEDCDKKIENLEKRINALDLENRLLTEQKPVLLSRLDKTLEEISDVEKELRKIEDSEEIKDVKFMISSLRERIETRNKENDLVNYKYTFTKKEIEDLVVMLDNCNDILLTTYEFGKEPIKKAISYLESRNNISEYVAEHKNKVFKNKLQACCEYVYREITKRVGNVRPLCNESNSCKVMEFYDEIFDLATEEPDTVIEDDEFVTYTKMAYQNISTIIKNMKSHKDTFEKLPKEIQDMFTLNEIFNRMENLKFLYEKEELYHILTLVTEYELQEEDLLKLNELKQKLSLLEKSLGNTEYLQHRKEDLLSEKDSLEDNIEDISDTLRSYMEELSTYKKECEYLKEIKSALQNKDNLVSELNELVEKYDTLKDLYEKQKMIEKELSCTLYEKNKVEKEYTTNEYRLKSYKELNEELVKYNDIYEEKELIKTSLSSKEGIPLLYIQIYLENIKDITNDLLQIIYDDELYIEDFSITANEFKIPYVTKGTEIKDVCYASQGERSFISLALSFALIYQSISRYNIMLLDEIDSTLDTSNREKFLQILEKQMDMIEGEQIFVISHNNMFNMYPVDIIDTKNKTNADNKLANYIQIKMK